MTTTRTGMVARITSIVVLAGAVSACADREGILGTRMGQYAQYSRSSETQEILRNSAFLMVKGRSREESIRTFQDDGAICDSNTCVWTFLKRESSVNRRIINAPGPPRTYLRTYTITVLSDTVQTIQDISAKYTQVTVEP